MLISIWFFPFLFYAFAFFYNNVIAFRSIWKIAGGEKAVEKFPLTRGNTFFASIGFIACWDQIKNFINTYHSHVVMKRHSHLVLSLPRSY